MEIPKQEHEKMVGLTALFQPSKRIIDVLPEKGVVVITGRPGMGKTTLLISILSESILVEKPCVYYSLAHSDVQIVRRLLTNLTGMSHEYLFNKMLKQDNEKIPPIIQYLSSRNSIEIDDTLYADIDELLLNIKANCQRTSVKFILIDSLESLNFKRHKKYMTHTFEELKNLSETLDVLIVVTLQLPITFTPIDNWKNINIDEIKECIVWSCNIEQFYIINRPGYCHNNYLGIYKDTNEGFAELIRISSKSSVLPLQISVATSKIEPLSDSI